MSRCWSVLACLLLRAALPGVAASPGTTAPSTSNETCTDQPGGWEFVPRGTWDEWTMAQPPVSLNPHDAGVAIADTATLSYVDAHTGGVRWQTPCSTGNPFPPVVSDDGETVFCATLGGTVVVVPAKGNGTAAFRSTFSPAPQSRTAMALAFDATNNALLIVVTLQTQGMWGLRVPSAPPYGVHVAFAIVPPARFPHFVSRVGFGLGGGSVVFLAPQWGLGCVVQNGNSTAQLAWSAIDYSQPDGALVVANDTVFATRVWTVEALRVQDGAVVWELPSRVCVYGSAPSLVVLDSASGQLFVGSCDWHMTLFVHKVDVRTGAHSTLMSARSVDNTAIALALHPLHANRDDGQQDILVLLEDSASLRLLVVDAVSGQQQWRTLARPTVPRWSINMVGLGALPGGRVVWSSARGNRVGSSCHVYQTDRLWLGARVWLSTSLVLAIFAVAAACALLAPAASLPLSKHAAYIGAQVLFVAAIAVLNLPPVLARLRCSFDLDGSAQPIPSGVFPFIANASAVGWFLVLGIVCANSLATGRVLRALVRSAEARELISRVQAILVARPPRATLITLVALMGLQLVRPGTGFLRMPAFEVLYAAQATYQCADKAFAVVLLIQVVFASAICVLVCPELPLRTYWAKLRGAHLYGRAAAITHIAAFAVVGFGVVWCAKVALDTRGTAAVVVGATTGILSLLCLETSDHARRLGGAAKIFPHQQQPPTPAEGDDEDGRAAGIADPGAMSPREAIDAPEHNQARLFELVQGFPERVSALGLVFGLGGAFAVFGTAVYLDGAGTWVCAAATIAAFAHVYFVSIGKQHLFEAWVDARVRSLRGDHGEKEFADHLVGGSASARGGGPVGDLAEERTFCLPAWLHPRRKSPWHRQQLIVAGYQVVNAFFFAYVLPQLRHDRNMAPLAWLGLAGALVGTAVPVVTIRGATSRALAHWVPLDNSFRVSNLLKSATLIVKLMLLTLASSLSHPSASQRTLDAVLVAFYVLGGVIVGILTWIDFRSLWEVPFMGSLWTSRGMVLAYAIGFAWTMVGLVFLLLNVHNVDSAQSRYVNVVLVALTPTTSYINNETVRYFVGCRAHPHRLDQALLAQELTRPEAFPRGGLFSKGGLNVLNEWQLLVVVLCLGFSCFQLTIEQNARVGLLVFLLCVLTVKCLIVAACTKAR